MFRVLPAPDDKWRVVQTRENSVGGWTVVEIISEHEDYDEACQSRQDEQENAK